MLNTILIIFVILVFSLSIIFYYVKFLKTDKKVMIQKDLYSLDYLTNYIQKYFDEILRKNLYQENLSKINFEKQLNKRKTLRKNLKACIYGDLNAKKYIKEYIKDILRKKLAISEKNIDKIINFRNPNELSIVDKFDILIHIYKKEYGYNGLEKMIAENNLDDLKEDRFFIDRKDIEKIFSKKYITLSFKDKLSIISQKIYQKYKGYGVVDELRDMKIDGISGGVSGVPKNFFYSFNQTKDFSDIARLPSEYDSIWIFFKGKSIHLKFLSFNTQRELIRVCKNIYKYGNPGQLTESQGYKVNKMKDGSRVVVVRPPFCESWAFFVRKFDSIEKKKISDLIVDTNNELCINFLKWIIKGLSISAITGSQGAGKTTLLMSLIKFINPTYNLRIQEMAFELHLRKIYPYRNILTFKQTKDIAGQEGLNLQKKTDGAVNILGEVASAPVASWMIQMSQVASLFTIFTHHAKTSDHLIKSLRNNLLETKIFSNEKIATEQVADVIDYDIHLAKNQDGHRYIERISQIVMPKKQRVDLKQNIKKSDLISIMAKYFQKEINNRYNIKDIIVWEDGEYIVKNPISKREISRIKKSLNLKQKNLFNKFIKKNGLIK